MHLRQSEFTYSALDQLQKQRKNTKIKKTGDSRYIYQNELDKACFEHDMVYGDFKDFARKTASDKILHDRAFNITKNPKYDGYQRVLASLVYKFFVEKNSGGSIKDSNMPGQ